MEMSENAAKAEAASEFVHLSAKMGKMIVRRYVLEAIFIFLLISIFIGGYVMGKHHLWDHDFDLEIDVEIDSDDEPAKEAEVKDKKKKSGDKHV